MSCGEQSKNLSKTFPSNPSNSKMASSGKYIPPALRAKMAAEAAAVAEAERAAVAAPAAPRDELAAWLRESQKGFVAKTPEQIRQECLLMNYAQLRSRAGPPPPVTSDDFGGAHEQGGEGEGARVCVSFDESLRLFKQGRGGPPEPLCFDGRDDGEMVSDGIAEAVYCGQSKSQKMRRAYSAWYAQWGERLTYLWRAEHGLAVTAKKLPPVQRKRTEEYKEPTRGQRAMAAAGELCEKSGW
jgi:hypothetical protein